ncbi:hypothetical protein [Chitinophaga niabensis]|uniref:TolB-like 6-blade propeller-like n=1 Tax=Chitinophaga niabensis TaxID=536979 RepID=A0A1N6KAL0_9BACT|nr:hypothetical protein [Chitinophaga niabensis]SIO53592.1 hypothetical protein SAMN04488055_5443 [Chitinophaga niabensis]
MKINKIAKFVIICIATCGGLVLILYAFMPRPNSIKNGFVRNIIPAKAKLEKVLDTKYTAYYFAGNTDHHIYLGNYSSAMHILVVNSDLTDTTTYTQHLEKNEKGAWKLARLIVDSPTVYISDGITPAIYRSNLHELSLSKYFERSCFFTSAINVSPNSFLVKGVKNKENLLLKVTNDSPYVKPMPNVLEKQVDGLFCTDGTLIIDPETKNLIYLYYYRNEFLKLDTSLNIIYKGHSIDTNRVAQIKIADVTSHSKRIMSAPPTFVNRSGTIYKNRLYISSALRADNEQSKEYNKNETIDVYSLENGEYINSFYMPKFKGAKAEQYRIVNNRIIAIYEHTLCMYSLPEEINDHISIK